VIDISDPARPVEVGVCEKVRNSFPGPTVWSMDVVDDYAYVGVGADGTFLWVVDISDPTAPVEVGFYSLQSAYVAPDDIAVVDSHAYVVGFAGLQVMDVSDPAVPTPVGTYTTDGILWSSVAVANNYVYLGAMYPNDLRVIDISDPTAPVEVGFYTPPGDAREVAVAGSFAYILDEYHSGLRVVDISNPTTPIKVDFYDLPNPSQFDAIAVANGYVYAGAGAAGLYILRHGSAVSNPMDGTPIATYSGPGQDYIGFPTFSPSGDLVFMSADVAEDQITMVIFKGYCLNNYYTLISPAVRARTQPPAESNP
jgi:hypothetical protein